MVLPDGDLNKAVSARRYRRAEILAARSLLSGAGVSLEALERKSLSLYFVSVAAAWIGVAGLVAFSRTAGLFAGLVSVVLVGYLQRALGNLLHDFAHGGFRFCRLADLIATCLVALPLMATLRQYRVTHFAHHKYLGEPSLDPDFIHDPESLKQGGWHAMAICLTSKEIWLNSLLGQLAKPHGTPKLTILIWWLVVPASVSLVFGAAAALAFVGLWFAARATSFHLITTFREFADHAGLAPGSILSFTRNSPNRGWLRHIAHPYENGLHVAHHLLPRVPFYKLGRAHRLLLTWPYYAAGEHCASYFMPQAGEPPSVYDSLSIHLRFPAKTATPDLATKRPGGGAAR